jgi:hypothetical protein
MRSNCDFFPAHAKDLAVPCELERYVTATEGSLLCDMSLDEDTACAC